MASLRGESGQEMFKSFLQDEVAPMMRARGWKGSGQSYKRTSDLYRAFINFQKSRHNTRVEVEFTVNLGVANDRAIGDLQVASKLAREHWGRDTVVFPTWGTWSQRIGYLLPIRRDKWWRFVTGQSPEPTAAEVRSALSDYALPALERQMQKPRVDPGFVIERCGSLVDQRFLPDGDIKFYNVDGERLYPLDALSDFIDRVPVQPVMRPPSPTIPVELSAVGTDGWISLEDDAIRRRLDDKGLSLTNDVQVAFSLSWVDVEGRRRGNYWLAGEARYDPERGWGVEASPASVRAYLEAAKREGYSPPPGEDGIAR